MSIRSRSVVVAFCLLLLQAAFARAEAPKFYPLQVHVFSRHVHHSHRSGYFYGDGRANLIDENQVHAVEFTYDCLHKFLDSEADEYYPARWIHEGLKLEILAGVIGSDTKTRTCEFNVALKEFVYRRQGGHVSTISQQEYSAHNYAKDERALAMIPFDPDPAHYPIQVALLHLTWNDTFSEVHVGAGQGNIRTPSGLNAVDFSLHCPVKIQPTPEGRYLLGQWLEPNTHMLLLLRSVDVDGGPGATCDLTTVVDPDVYIRTGEGVKAISQADYQKRHPQDPGPTNP